MVDHLVRQLALNPVLQQDRLALARADSPARLEVDRLAPRQHEDERVRLLHRGEVSVESLYGPGCDRRW
jgi:hypothetical protein